MSYPFRQPINTEDSPDDWTPPDYAKPATDNKEEWQPPEYAVAQKEEEKPTIFSRIKKALTPAEKIHPDPNSPLNRFISGVTAIPESMYKSVSDIGKTSAEQLKQGDIHGAFKTVTSPLMGPIDTVNEMLANKAQGKDINLPSKPQAKEEGISQILGVAGIPGKEAIDAYKSGNYSKLAGMGLTSAAIAGLAHYSGSSPTIEGELPVRRPPVSTEIPYKLGQETPTAADIPSIKRANMQEYMKKNPNATVPEIKKFVDSVQSSIPDINTVEDLKNRYNEIDMKERDRLRATGEDIPDNEGARALEKARKDIEAKWKPPSYAEETPAEKPAFVNPFEKKPSNVKQLTGQMIRDKEYDKLWNNPNEDSFSNTLDRHIKSINEELDPEVIKDNYNNWQQELDNRKLHGSQDDIETAGTLRDEAYAKLNQLNKSWQPPEYAQTVKKGDITPSAKPQPIIEHPLINPQTGAPGTPESLHPDLTALKNYGDGIVNVDFGKDMKPEEIQSLFPKAQITDLSSSSMPNHFRLDFKNPEDADNVEKSVGGAFDNSSPVEMHGELGGINPPGGDEPFKGTAGAVVDKLMNALKESKGLNVEQQAINKAERAKRFAAFSGVKQEGASGAAKSLGKLRGEFEKVNPGAGLQLKPEETDSLFTAVKRARITEGEKARGYTALFKLMNGEGVPVRSELKILDDVFGNGFADQITEMHGGIGAVGLKVSKLANTMKSMQNAISLAAPLRHGIGLVARKEFYPAFADMFKFFGNKEFYDASMNAIIDHPDYIKYREAGGFFAKAGSLQDSEEEFLNSYIGSVPVARNVVGASQRGYTGFLNKLRFDTWQSMSKKAEGLGVKMFDSIRDEEGNVTHTPTKEAKAITRYINNATGRGSLGSLNKMTNELNMVLWSPRMISSRLTMLTNPKIYTDLPKGMRLDGLKSLLGIAALGTTIDTLAAYGGAKVSTNILSSDFGKSRFGKDVIDPWGSFQQPIVAAARFLAGKTDTSQPTTRLDIAGRFAANKESPAASLVHTILTSKPTKGGGAGDITTEYGQKTNVQSEVAKRFTPIFIQDLITLTQTQPQWSEDIGLTAAMAGASITGMAQQYPEPKKKGQLTFRKMKLQ